MTVFEAEQNKFLRFFCRFTRYRTVNVNAFCVTNEFASLKLIRL